MIHSTLKSLRALAGRLCMVLAMSLTPLPAAMAETLLRASEAEITGYIRSNAAVEAWRKTAEDRLGVQPPDDLHPLQTLVDAGADAQALDTILRKHGFADLQAFTASEARLSDIYTLLYADTSGLARMSVTLQLAATGHMVSKRERARMVARERSAIEAERRARVDPETIPLIARHALALGRALGDTQEP